MSSLSPAAVLFDVNGVSLAVYNNTALVANQPLLPLAGVDGYSSVTRNILVSGQGSVLSAPSSNNVVVFSNGTITANGQDLFTSQYFGTQQIDLIVNITAAPTGTTPTITFTLQEVDPGNGTTVYGQSATTGALNSTGVTAISISGTTSSAVRVSWTVGGTTPSFTGVYVTLTTKATPGTQPVSGTVAATQSGAWTVTANAGTGTFTVAGTVTSNQGTPNTLANAWPVEITDGTNVLGTSGHPIYVQGTITATNPSVGTDGAAALTSDTQVGGVTSTNAPTYTTGNLDALSLTTKGGLRIDGVFPTGAAVPISDAMYVGGAVTTAAPTYTTGQMNALSLDTSGNLRVNIGAGTVAVTQSTSPWIVAGGGTAGSAATGVVTIQGISGMTPVVVTTDKATTSTVTSVAGSTSSTSILASNANRQAASIYNNTNKNMYVLCNSGTASTSNFTILLMQGSYWEVPSDYTGAINAIWANGVSGSALVTEYTP